MSLFSIIPIGILCLLALPPALKEESWRRFFLAFILSFVGIALPLFVFFGSLFLGPESKGECVHGWLDCFITGKLALTPIVLLATAALYALEILRVKNRTARWIVIGIFLGAIVSSICFMIGLVCAEVNGFEFGLLVPFYVAIWYSARAVEQIKKARLNFWIYLISLACSLPFWLWSWLLSRSEYASLPQKAPDCFIVTAAGQGHAAFVGTHIEIERNGRRLLANQQLITFWQFEDLWRNFAPRSHRIFRCGYNRVGPMIAAQIKSPWLADFTYLAIKPLELVAKFANATMGKIKNFAKQKS